MARVGGRRGGAALGSTARGAGSLAVAAGTRARTTALSEAAHLGTLTLVPVALERERGRAPEVGVDDATAVGATGSEASVAAAGGVDLGTEGSAAAPFVDASPHRVEPTARASLPTSVRAGAAEHPVDATGPETSAKRAGETRQAGKKKRDRASETAAPARDDAAMLDMPRAAHREADAQVAPVGEASGPTDTPAAPAPETRASAQATGETVAGTQREADPSTPAEKVNEPKSAASASAYANAPTDVTSAAAGEASAPAGEASAPADGASETVGEVQGEVGPLAPSEKANEPNNATNPRAQANEPIDESVALAGEANDRAHAVTETKGQPREPTGTVAGADEEASAAAQPKSRTRQRSAVEGGAASEPTEGASARADGDAPSGTPRGRKRAKRTPRTTTPQGDRTPQESR